MNIIDTNGVHQIFKSNLALQDDYYLVPDVEDEVEMTQMIHGKGLPARIVGISQTGNFDEAIYLKYYREILNKYGGRSFYNMTGFGDVSILATLLMLTEIVANQQQGNLFQILDQATVYTDDIPLITKIKKELGGTRVIVRPTSEIS